MNSKVIVVLTLLLIVASFLGGSLFTRLRWLDKDKEVPAKGEVAGEKAASSPAAFDAPDEEKPLVEFFVMSFCPYGNQAEIGLEPVYQLLQDKVTWQPRYIVDDKKVSCETQCQYQVFDQNRCEELIEAERIPDMETCREYFPYDNEETCLSEECEDLIGGEFTSLHGEQELNQNVREICVLEELGIEEYWQFVSEINEECSSENADNCWLGVADGLGLDQSRITGCFNNRLQEILKEELRINSERGVSGSPTIFINGQLYQGGRAPEDYKKAICSGFTEVPRECESVLGEETEAPAGGGC